MKGINTHSFALTESSPLDQVTEAPEAAASREPNLMNSANILSPCDPIMNHTEVSFRFGRGFYELDDVLAGRMTRLFGMGG